MRKVFEITFAGESFKTLLASSAEEALNLAKTERPALALVDHTLADMTGYDLCRELKAIAPSMAVVVMASKQSPYDKARGAATGVDDFVDKPFDTQKLIDKVNQVLSQPRAAAAAAKPAAPVAPAPAVMPTATAKPRSQTLSYGTPAPAPAAQHPAPAAAPARAVAAAPTSAARPAAPAAAPRLAPQPVAAPAARANDAVAAAVASGNGQLESKLEALGLTSSQVEGVLALSREVVEKVVWEVVPVLAETIIKEEIRRLTAE
jgi:CheY-like chemotaxis protein